MNNGEPTAENDVAVPVFSHPVDKPKSHIWNHSHTFFTLFDFDLYDGIFGPSAKQVIEFDISVSDTMFVAMMKSDKYLNENESRMFFLHELMF